MPNTKERHLEIYNAAAKVLKTVGGVLVIDNLPQEDRRPQLLSMAKLVKEQTNCHITSAKSNLAKAMRRARYGIMQEQWGGRRPGTGRPKTSE